MYHTILKQDNTMEIKEEYFLCMHCKHYDRFAGNCKAFPNGVIPTGELDIYGDNTEEEEILRKLWLIDDDLPLDEFKEVFHRNPIPGQVGDYIFESLNA